jgi:NAD(P)-dependent dehydrogenase (short-subunit alcohol dehydrogenase family)
MGLRSSCTADRSEESPSSWFANWVSAPPIVCADLTDNSACAALWDEALAWRGSIDVLVNNAGAWIASPVADAS